MKLKEILYALGWQPRAREYPFLVDAFVLPREGEVKYARWQHPHESRKEFTQGMVDALRGFLRPGDVALDIGAHTGDTALPMALAVGPQGMVFALEPNPYVFKVLEANAGLNREKARIQALMFAAAAEDSELEFDYSDPGFCNGGLHPGMNRWRHAHFFKLKVQGRRVADYLQREHPEALEKLRYVKIDTEGYDRGVAASLRELLASRRPYLKSEIYEHLPAEERRGYYQDLRALGYTVRKCNGEEDYFGPVLAEEDLLKWRHFDIFAVPGE
jgi:FkbM family methyltransferase